MKKRFKIALISLASIVFIVTIFALTDYIRLKNEKKPIFIYKNVAIYNNTKFVGTKYYGLGYSFFNCEVCSKKINFGLFYLSTYAWFIENSSITSIEAIENKKCSNEIKKYYTLSNDRSIYTYCLDKIKITEENDYTIDLADYLKLNSDAIYEIIENFTLKPEASFDDGGTKIYSGEGFNILACHTISGNNDIYIGTKQMGYNKGFCQ